MSMGLLTSGFIKIFVHCIDISEVNFVNCNLNLVEGIECCVQILFVAFVSKQFCYYLPVSV